MDEAESFLEIGRNGTKLWRDKYGQFHRLDGPAIEYANGDQSWFENGLLHRIDGPAMIFNRGGGKWHYRWHKKGVMHREDGPAVVCSGGEKEWWLDGVFYQTKEFFFDTLSDEAKMRCLFSKDFLNG
jgi:hypothetical protein